MSDNCQISKISSAYCLKSIFAYIEFNTALKLVKYNKSLQKKLDINLKDYSLDYDLKVRKDKNETTLYRAASIVLLVIIYFALILFFYQFVFAIIYISNKKPDVKEKIEIIKNKENIQESFGKSIIYERLQKLEISILVISPILLILSFIMYKQFNGHLNDRDVFFIGIIYLSIINGFKIYFLWEIYYIYENKKSNWVVINLLIMVVWFLIFFIYSLAFGFIEIFFGYKIVETTYIIKFQGIEINPLEIDNNFYKKSPDEKKRYILNKTKEMTVKYSENKRYFEMIQSTINEYRIENQLDVLKFVEKLPKFIIKGNLLVKFTLNNIIKIGYKKYLFKYPSGEFLAQLNAKNKKILGILSLDYLNSIKIVKIDKIEYILVYDDRNDKIDRNITVNYDNSITEREDLNNQNEFKDEKNKINKIIKFKQIKSLK